MDLGIVDELIQSQRIDTRPEGAGRPRSLRAAEIFDYWQERVEVISRETVPSLLVLDSFYPGWQAEIDDVPTPVLRVNDLLRGVVVPEGVHRGTVTFMPASQLLMRACAQCGSYHPASAGRRSGDVASYALTDWPPDQSPTRRTTK